MINSAKASEEALIRIRDLDPHFLAVKESWPPVMSIQPQLTITDLYTALQPQEFGALVNLANR